MKFVKNAAKADIAYWNTSFPNDNGHHWGTGAGPYTVGY